MEDLIEKVEDNTQKEKKIKSLIVKRIETLDYLHQIHEHEKTVQWVNLVLLNKEDIIKAIGENTVQKRAKFWFLLGVNLASLVQIQNVPTYVRSLLQMMEELEHYMGTIGSTHLNPLQGYKAGVSVHLDKEYESFKPKLHKIGSTVAYEFLTVFNIPCELDYFRIIITLCEVLKLVYQKFRDDSSSSKYIYEAIIKFDSRVKTEFFASLEKESHKLAKKVVQEQIIDNNSIFKAWGVA